MISNVRRVALAGVGVACLVAAAALAASYRVGIYTVGNTKTGSGLQMRVRSDSFSVRVMRFPERCRYGSRTISDYFTFKAGSRASLRGRIAPNGSLSGQYRAFNGIASASGHVRGGVATVTGTEHGPYNPASTVQPNFCRGSHTFRAALASR